MSLTFCIRGGGPDLPGAWGEGRTPGRGQACWRRAVKDRDCCQPERPEKSSHESTGHRAKGRERWGPGGAGRQPGSRDHKKQQPSPTSRRWARPPRRLAAAEQHWASRRLAGPSLRPLFRPPHLALMDARATVGGSQDRYANQHCTEPPVLSPTPNFVGGELGVAEKGERLTSTLRTHSMNN